MKKVLSTLALMACIMMALPAQAQLKFGLKGGLNISKVTFSAVISIRTIVPASLSVRWLSLLFLLSA